jgi:hypothetical protein
MTTVSYSIHDLGTNSISLLTIYLYELNIRLFNSSALAEQESLMRKIVRTIVALTALLVGLLPPAQATTITQWTFENLSIATNNSPAPSTGSGAAGSIAMDVYPTPAVGVTTDDVLQGTNGDTGPYLPAIIPFIPALRSRIDATM